MSGSSGGETRAARPAPPDSRGTRRPRRDVDRRPYSGRDHYDHDYYDRDYYFHGHTYYPHYGYSHYRYYGYPYYPHRYPYYYWWIGFDYYPFYGVFPVPYYTRYAEGRGALDLDVSPEKAEVYLNGQYIGVADEYDGFPGYLWLEEGTYDVVFYKPGYRTLARQYSIYPGLVIAVEDRMTPGDAVRPEDLVATSTEVRDERLRRDEERREQAAAAAVEAQRYREDAAAGAPLDARSQPAELRLTVEPADASIYLDGRFVGTALDLARRGSLLWVDPGSHVLDVVRPGHENERVDFEVKAGGELELAVTLEPTAG